MMPMWLRVFVCGIVMLLSGCASYHAFVTRSHEQALCKSTCRQQQGICQTRCHDHCQECGWQESKITAKHYSEYKHQQFVQGIPVVRTLNSYRDPLRCLKITCDCRADYRLCVQSCADKSSSESSHDK